MVALAIGMLAAIVMMQMFALSEERSRTASTGGDAQTNGIITFYQLQSNINRAGYGFNSISLFNCNTTWKVASGSLLSNAVRIAPVTINPISGASTALIPAGDPNTDTLLVMFGNGNGQPEGNKADTATNPVYTMQMANSFTVGDRVIAAASDVPDVCAANLLIDQISTVAPTTVTVAAGATGTTLFNLGPGVAGLPTAAGPNGPTILAYAIRGGNLTTCDFVLNDCSLAANTGDAAVWEPIASNIVSLRAQYGQDTSSSMIGVVDSYNQTTPTTACGWARASAVRLALVAKSAQFEKTVVTAAAPVWDGSASTAIDLTKKPDGTANPNWQNYRYKLFQAVMPIRNVAWMGVPTGC